MNAELIVVGVALGAGVAVSLPMTLLLRRIGHRSLGTSVLVAALSGVLSTAVSAVAGAEVMFLSGHDLHVLLVLCAVSTAVATAAGLMVAGSLNRSVASLGEDARRLGAGDLLTHARDRGAVSGVRAQLAEASHRLAESRARERALESSRRELVAWVSHDLRTPLAGLRAMSEALVDGVVSDPATTRLYAERMVEETARLSGMVDDLFELARLQAGAIALSFEKLSLDDLVSDAVSSTRPLAEMKGVRLRGAAAPPDATVEVSAPELGRALRNLLVNAIRHTPGDGDVTVSRGVHGDQAWVAVHDACGGIPADDLPRVFHVAFRGSTARSRDDGGGGLGLAIARGIVEAHHGRIEVCNDGPGCRFVISLPTSRDPVPL